MVLHLFGNFDFVDFGRIMFRGSRNRTRCGGYRASSGFETRLGGPEPVPENTYNMHRPLATLDSAWLLDLVILSVLLFRGTAIGLDAVGRGLVLGSKHA